MKRLMLITYAFGLFACGGKGSASGTDSCSGEYPGAAGSYTMVYNRTSRSDTCETRDVDFVSGILTVTHNAGTLSLDFGSGYGASGCVESDGTFTVEGGSTTSEGEAIVYTLTGTFDGATLASSGDGITADFFFEDGNDTADCRVRGSFSGVLISAD